MLFGHTRKSTEPSDRNPTVIISNPGSTTGLKVVSTKLPIRPRTMETKLSIWQLRYLPLSPPAIGPGHDVRVVSSISRFAPVRHHPCFTALPAVMKALVEVKSEMATQAELIGRITIRRPRSLARRVRANVTESVGDRSSARFTISGPIQDRKSFIATPVFELTTVVGARP